MIDQKKAYISGIIAVLLWSTVASAFKLSLRYLNFIELLFYSSFMSCIVLAIVLFRMHKFIEVFHCTGKQYLRSLMLGMLNPFFYYLILFKAYDLLPAQEAQALNYTWALTLALLSIPLLKQHISLTDFTGLILGYLGVLVIATQGNIFQLHFSEPLGFGLALGSTFIWSIYWIYNTKDTRHPVVSLFLCFVFSIVPIMILYVLWCDFRIPELPGILGAAYVGIFEMSIAYIVWLTALKFSKNTAKVSSLIFFSPFISLILIYFLVGEIIKISTIAGLILIISGIIIQKMKRKSNK
jgi:drug/metabolite transporter (DMT)-like permease